MRLSSFLSFGLVAPVAFVLFACGSSTTGGSGGTGTTTATGGSAQGGGGGSATTTTSTTGSATVTATGTTTTSSSTSTAPDGLGLGEKCGGSADGGVCATGLACCYPCGIPGCEFLCATACQDGEPGCSNGCVQHP